MTDDQPRQDPPVWSVTTNPAVPTLRDQFAMVALTGWFSVLRLRDIDDYKGDDDAFAEHQRLVAVACYGYADAMLKAREVTP
jgi:hypothetical protein